MVRDGLLSCRAEIALCEPVLIRRDVRTSTRATRDIQSRKSRHVHFLPSFLTFAKRQRDTNARKIVNEPIYILGTGSQWRTIPKDLPPHDPHGCDAGKKRHIPADTLGLLLKAIVHSADIMDRDGAALALTKKTRALFAFVLRIFADAGYQGWRVALAAANSGTWEVEIVRRCDIINGIAGLPKRWIVERTIAWLNRCRRFAKDWERFNRKGLASICLMLRRLCNPARCSRTDSKESGPDAFPSHCGRSG